MRFAQPVCCQIVTVDNHACGRVTCVSLTERSLAIDLTRSVESLGAQTSLPTPRPNPRKTVDPSHSAYWPSTYRCLSRKLVKANNRAVCALVAARLKLPCGAMQRRSLAFFNLLGANVRPKAERMISGFSSPSGRACKRLTSISSSRSFPLIAAHHHSHYRLN